MIRNLTPEIIELISAKKVEIALFLYADFPSGVRRLWTGLGNYTDPFANTWQGIGGIITIEQVQETTDTAAVGINCTLNGLEPSIVNSVVQENYQGRRAELLIGFWKRPGEGDSSAGIVPPAVLVFPEEPIWRGTLDTDESTISRTETSLTIKCEHRMADILRRREFRYTNRDQQLLYPTFGDTGLSHIEAIQDLTIPWGRAQK